MQSKAKSSPLDAAGQMCEGWEQGGTIKAEGKFETMMFPFNFISNEAMQKLVPLARERDVGSIVMKPTGGAGCWRT